MLARHLHHHFTDEHETPSLIGAPDGLAVEDVDNGVGSDHLLKPLLHLPGSCSGFMQMNQRFQELMLTILDSLLAQELEQKPEQALIPKSPHQTREVEVRYFVNTINCDQTTNHTAPSRRI